MSETPRLSGSCTSASDGSLQRIGDAFRQADALDQTDTEPAEYCGAHPVGVLNCQEGRNACAHRIAHDVGALDFQMIEQCADIVGHYRAVIGGRVVKLARCAMPAIVERNHATAQRALSVLTQPGCTQLTSFVDANPCTSTIGSPSPSSR